MAVEVQTPATPLQEQVADAAGSIVEPVQDAIAIVAEALPPPAQPQPVEPLVAAAAVSMIIRFEIGSPTQYTKKYRRPVWPKGASGVTWCVGYDGGHQIASVIADDWSAHPNKTDLVTTAGITGGRAQAILPRYRHIVTDYPYCEQIFSERTLVEYERRTKRTFPGYEELRPLTRGSLISVVYNRGASKVGKNRREMKVIADECVPAKDYRCIAAQIRSMKRLWVGTPNEKGLGSRREAEALLVEKDLNPTGE